jgi:hypothetical protein
VCLVSCCDQIEISCSQTIFMNNGTRRELTGTSRLRPLIEGSKNKTTDATCHWDASIKFSLFATVSSSSLCEKMRIGYTSEECIKFVWQTCPGFHCLQSSAHVREAASEGSVAP